MKNYLVMYYLYLDESGDTGDYLDKNDNIIQGSSKFFTLAGIIINDRKKTKMEKTINDLIAQYFKKKELPDNFKLHYHPLRNKRKPYDNLTNLQRKCLADAVFDTIIQTDCTILSVTINLERHCKKYPTPADPRAYIIFIMLERFQDFLREYDSKGVVIYEKYNHTLRRKVDYTLSWLRFALSHRNSRDLKNIEGHVKNGDPALESILQLSDFLAYSVWIKRTSGGEARSRWDSIKEKYYKFDAGWYKEGNVEI